MNKELTAYFESGCNAILITAKHVLNNYTIQSSRDIYHDYSSYGTNINNEVEKVLKIHLSPMRVPIFNINQANMVYNDNSKKRDLYYWVINPCDNSIELKNRCQNFSISLVLMYDQKVLLSIVSLPTEDKIYFKYLDKGIFVIEGLIKKRFEPPVNYLMTMAKPISIEDIDSEQDSDQKELNHQNWFG